MSGQNGDPIDDAIAAASAPPPVRMRQIEVTISSTGRPCVIALPADATDGEIAEVAGWLLTAVLGQYRARRKPGIILPT